jgi:SAM-dependent methyltransferase
MTAEQSRVISPSPAARARAAETLPPLPGLGEALAGVDGTFLEVGSGYGVRLRGLYDAGFLRGFARIIATDVDAGRVAFTRELVPEAEGTVCDAARLPFDSGSVDFVFSDQVIEHVPSDAAMAAEIARILRAQGRAYVGSVLKRRWAWYFYRNGGAWRLEPTHLREYESLAEYRSVFESAGLCVTEAYAAPMLFPVGEALLRVLVRLRFIAAASFYDVHATSPLLRFLSTMRFRIPGYYGCWVALRK